MFRKFREPASPRAHHAPRLPDRRRRCRRRLRRRLPPARRAGRRTPPAAAPINPFDAYVTITADDRVTVISSQFDMGQGSYHGIATLVLEELGARWDQTDVVGGWGDPKNYGNLA